MMEEPNDLDEDDMGREVGITAALPGWWAVRRYRDTKEELGRDDVAGEVLTEDTIRMKDGHLRRRPRLYGVDPSGSGWAGDVIETIYVDYIYDPHFRSDQSYANRDEVPV